MAKKKSKKAMLEEDTTVKAKSKEKTNEEGFKAAAVDEDRLTKALSTLEEYKKGKKSLEEKTIENDKWWRSRHWEVIGDGNNKENYPVSAWLVNTILSKHADAMDAYPEPNILPREEGDKDIANELSSVIPVILDQNGFEKVYYDNWFDKLKNGTAIYGIFWDKTKLNGLGDISIKSVDMLNIYWEPGVQDIQDSRNVFHVELVDNDLLEERYPELKDNLGGNKSLVAKYEYDDKVDTDKKSLVVDWYYKVEKDGKTVLHYCKFCGKTVIYATEDDIESSVEKTTVVNDMGELEETEHSIDESVAEEGWYKHGKYPFVISSLYPVKGTPSGFGYIDLCKSPQEYIDKMNMAFLTNTLNTARPRFMVRNDSGINEEELADPNKTVIHVEGNFDDSNLKPIQTQNLNGSHFSMLNMKIEEMKETSGNRDVNNGGTTKGVTAASAIAAMQEEGSKLSRDIIKADRRDYVEIVYQVIELIRQFYTLPRKYRITGHDGSVEFKTFDNSHLQVQEVEEDSYKIPIFDIDVTAQSESAYNKMAQNELALQFYNLGFFNPDMLEQAVMCIDMMDFKGKGELKKKLQEMLEVKRNMARLNAMIPQGIPGLPPAPIPAPIKANLKEGLVETNPAGEPIAKEHGIVSRAREEAAERSQPK